MKTLCLAATVAALATLVPAAPATAEEATQDKPVILVVPGGVKDHPAAEYQWAAEMTAARIKGNTQTLEGDLGAALKYARENKGKVAGIVEILVDVYSWDEEVRITCYDPVGRKRWKDKVSLNMGGSEEALARKMVERAIVKAEKRPACAGGH